MFSLPKLVTLLLMNCTAISSVMIAEENQLKQPEEALLADIHRAIAYSGFRHGQHPDRGAGAILPTDEQILEDLRILDSLDFNLIRLYDSQQNSRDVLNVIREHKLPIKVMLGIWIKAELSNHEGCAWITEPTPQDELDLNRLKNEKEINRGIELANEFDDIVVAVNVGNESLVTWNDHLVTIDTMIGYLQKVKAAIPQPISTADNYEVFFEYGTKLADHVDFLAVHTYPSWESKTIEEALPYTIDNLLKVRSSIPDKPIVIAEAGWASIAEEFGERASEENQARHFSELSTFTKEHNITLFWFEAFDEDWKGNDNNPLGAEKHWGIFDINRKPKLAAEQLLFEAGKPSLLNKN